MAIDDAARRRLDEAMDQRRLELGLEWREVAERAGITYETLRAARRGKGNIPPRTRRAIERGLQWSPGSVAELLAGRSPTRDVAAITEGEVAQGHERILSATPQELVEMRSVIEGVLGREEADEFLTRAIALREGVATDDATARDAS
jgi:transcriptional regulator with XRE-family HTH domain